MGWQVKYETKAEKQLVKLPFQEQLRITDKLREISDSENPRERGKSLKGKFSNRWRYRIGDYRVICDIQDDILVILVIEIGHRSKVYKKK